jgi:hypothetical protein
LSQCHVDGGGAAVGLGDADRHLLPGPQAGQDGCQCLGVGGGRSVDRGDDVTGLQAGLGGRAARSHRGGVDARGLAIGPVVREIERKYDLAAGGTPALDAVQAMTGTSGDCRGLAARRAVPGRRLLRHRGSAADRRRHHAATAHRRRGCGWHLKLPAGADTRDEIRLPPDASGGKRAATPGARADGAVSAARRRAAQQPPLTRDSPAGAHWGRRRTNDRRGARWSAWPVQPPKGRRCRRGRRTRRPRLRSEAVPRGSRPADRLPAAERQRNPRSGSSPAAAREPGPSAFLYGNNGRAALSGRCEGDA